MTELTHSEALSDVGRTTTVVPTQGVITAHDGTLVAESFQTRLTAI